MKLIKPSVEIIKQEEYDLNHIFKFIELAGRTCYKSEDKITEDSAKEFVDRMIKSGHGAMLEHGTVYLTIPTFYTQDVGILKYELNPYSKVVCTDDNIYITTNYRTIIENNWNEHLKYITSPTEFHEKRITVRFIANIHFYKDLTRHRKMSYAIESTRFCNYTKDKFGGELTFIQPCWIKEEYVPGDYNRSEQFVMFTEMLENIESTYNFMINSGWQAQQAANILPQATKAEIIVTGFAKDWKYIFDLRAIGTTGKPHPQMQELMIPLMKEFINRKYISYDTECMV